MTSVVLAWRVLHPHNCNGIGGCSRSVIGLGLKTGAFCYLGTTCATVFGAACHPHGLATISQKITMTEEKAGTPSQNQIRE